LHKGWARSDLDTAETGLCTNPDIDRHRPILSTTDAIINICVCSGREERAAAQSSAAEAVAAKEGLVQQINT
jgi:hypothetical protein